MGYVVMGMFSLKSGTPEYDEYVNQGYARHKENQLMHLAGIKGRYQHLKIDWDEQIEREAMRRDGGGITAYLRQISEYQETLREEARIRQYEKNPMYGAW